MRGSSNLAAGSIVGPPCPLGSLGIVRRQTAERKRTLAQLNVRCRHSASSRFSATFARWPPPWITTRRARDAGREHRCRPPWPLLPRPPFPYYGAQTPPPVFLRPESGRSRFSTECSPAIVLSGRPRQVHLPRKPLAAVSGPAAAESWAHSKAARRCLTAIAAYAALPACVQVPG